MSDFKREGVFVSASVLHALKRFWKVSQEPVFGMTTAQTLRQAERVDKATADFHQLLDDAAECLELPKPKKDKDGDVIHYGLDFDNGEILSVPE